MITVAAIRMEQFGVQFYQASLTARDVNKLVRFEVLSYGDKGHQPVRGGKGKSKVNWDLLERRIAAQREVLPAADHPKEDRGAGAVLRAVPRGAQSAVDSGRRHHRVGGAAEVRARRGRRPNLGILKVPEREGILRAIDGQHRLLALHNDVEQFGHDVFTCPAVIFDRLPEDHVVQMFVTINAKHTRLNPSHLVSLSGRQLYADPNLAAAHDVVRALTEREDSPLQRRDQAARRRPRPRGAGAAGAGAEARSSNPTLFGGARKAEEFRDDARKFFVNYFKQIASLFQTAWNGRKYSIKSAPALRAFIRVAPDVVQPARSGARRSARISARSVASSRRGAVASATCASRPTAPGSGRDRGSTSSPRNCGWRCSIPRVRRSDLLATAALSGGRGQPLDPRRYSAGPGGPAGSAGAACLGGAGALSAARRARARRIRAAIPAGPGRAGWQRGGCGWLAPRVLSSYRGQPFDPRRYSSRPWAGRLAARGLRLVGAARSQQLSRAARGSAPLFSRPWRRPGWQRGGCGSLAPARCSMPSRAARDPRGYSADPPRVGGRAARIGGLPDGR